MKTPETRPEWAELAIAALIKCHPSDAAQVCANQLAHLETGGPVMGDLIGTVVGDAGIWADCAPAHELVAYGIAAVDRLKGSPLGLETRKQLFAKLWEGFEAKDRRAFLSRVDPEGRFLRGAG